LGFFFVTPAAVFPSNIVAGRLFSFAVNQRRFPPPWSVEDIGGCFGREPVTTGRSYSSIMKKVSAVDPSRGY
jgi:hypothetical protein